MDIKPLGLRALTPHAAGIVHGNGLAEPDHRGTGAGTHQMRMGAV